jgi:hypothetical protein
VHRRYGEDPIRLRLPANREKQAALSHFQPHGVLISHGQSRMGRRELNEAVLDTARPVHRQAQPAALKGANPLPATLSQFDLRFELTT